MLLKKYYNFLIRGKYTGTCYLETFAEQALRQAVQIYVYPNPFHTLQDWI